MLGRLLGKALFGLGDAQRCTISYRRAVKLDEGGAPAWMGLAEVAESGGDAALAIEAYEHLVRVPAQHQTHSPQQQTRCGHKALLACSTAGTCVMRNGFALKHRFYCCRQRVLDRRRKRRRGRATANRS